MTIRLHRLLDQWYPRRNDCDWVLGTIIATERSAYRKAGAMMLFNGLGQRFGMLSGGCLEGNLAAEARKVLARNSAAVVDYDLTSDGLNNDGDTLHQWQDSIGCGGAVRILLQAVNQANAYLGLDLIHLAFKRGEPSLYRQKIDAVGIGKHHWQVAQPNTALGRNSTRKHDDPNGHFLETALFPAPKLMIAGGGTDAIPLAQLGYDIGWHVSVVDERHGYAEPEHFPNACCFCQSMTQLTALNLEPDAIVIMTHNLRLDAAALRFAHSSRATYIGVLGPEHRRVKVEQIAGLNADDFSQVYCGPVGLQIGASLPETIALSILAQCHQYVEGDRQGLPYSRNIAGVQSQ